MIRLGNDSKKHAVGFTIVELLIVIVVIAILAAITVVAYTGIQERARAAAARSSVLQAGKAIQAYAVTNGDVYPEDLMDAAILDSSTEAYTYIVNNEIKPARYCISVRSTQSFEVTYAFTSTSGGVIEGTCVRNHAVDPNGAGSTAYLESIGNNQASSSLTIASDRSFTGGTSYKRSITGSGQAFGGITAEGSLLISERVHWSYEVYSSRAGTMKNWSVGQRVSDGNNLGTGGIAGNQIVPANEWRHMSSSMSPSQDITMDRYGGYNLPVEAGDTVWLDAFMVTISDIEFQFADGSYPGWVWEGVPNESTSFGPAIPYAP